MSKRFGRNQRRRARQQVAELQSRVDGLTAARVMDAGLMADIKGREREHREALAYIVDAIAHHCRNSALLPPEHFVVDAEVIRGGGAIRIELQQRRSFGPPTDQADRTCNLDPFRTLDLHQIKVTVEAGADDLSRAAHAYVCSDHWGDVAYCVSDAAMQHRMHPSERRKLAHEISERLLDQFERRVQERARGVKVR